MNLATLSAAQLRKAAAIKEQIEQLHHELTGIFGTTATAPTASAPSKKGQISAAGIARIKAAQKLRWDKIRSAAAAAPVAPKKKKFTMSASAKAAISKAVKARWAKIRAAQKK